MHTRALRHFVAAAETQHIGRAAEQLGIAQPALSQQIRALETRLGVQLFRRANRRIELTEAGRVFLTEARQLLLASQRAIRLAQEAERGTAGELHIGYTGVAVFEPRLSTVLQRFRAAYPAVALTMHENTVEELMSALQDQRLDIAFLRGPIGALPPGLKQERFAQSPLVVALPAGHPLARRRRVPMSALQEEKFVVLPDSPGIGLMASLFQLCEQAGFSPRIALKTGSVMSALGLVGAGLGVSVIPYLPPAVSTGAFVLRPIEGTRIKTEVLLLARSRIVSPVERNFLGIVRTCGRQA